MILAASPGGVAANIFSHLSHGDVALNLTLTAINCVLAAFTVPLVVNLSIHHFGGSDAIGLQFKKTIEVFLIVLVPVAVGMLIRKTKPGLSAKADRPVRIFSIVVLALITVIAVLKERERMMTSMGHVDGYSVVWFSPDQVARVSARAAEARSPFARLNDLLAPVTPAKPVINCAVGEPQHPGAPRRVQRGRHMPPEPDRVVVRFVERQPRQRPAPRSPARGSAARRRRRAVPPARPPRWSRAPG